jgi:fermentation-respiration switch protein FrsA (DUF1100 family)
MLFVHGDDDRNVPIQQTTDLVEKLRAQNVAFEAIGALSGEQSQAHSAPTSRSTRDTSELRRMPLSLNL